MSLQATDREGLDRTREAHVAALNAGDVDGWVACFDADAVQMPPNQPPNIGAPSIQAWSRGFLTAFRAQFSLDPQEVELAGTDWAFERGAYQISLTPRAGGNPIQDVGKYLTIYRRQADDVWAMARDIWNSDNPPPVRA